MFEILRKTFQILNRRERLHFILITILMMVQAAVEVSGIASIAPFLAVLGNPDIVHTNRRIAWLYQRSGFHDAQSFLIALGVGAFVVLSLASAFRAWVSYARARYANARRHTLSHALLQKYIRQPYDFFLQHNSSALTTKILSESDMFISNALMSLMQLFSYGLVAAAIVALLLAVNFHLALIVAGTLGVIYGVIYTVLASTASRLGHSRKRVNAMRHQVTTEILGGIKELKVLGREQVYMDAYEWPSLHYARILTRYQTMSDTPRYLIEIVGFCALFLIVVSMLHDHADLGHALPVVGLYAFAAYRLMPAAQNIYNALTTMKFARAAVDELHDDLAGYDAAATIARTSDRLPVRQGIAFRGVGFRYPNAERDTLSGLDFTIPAMRATGIVGSTGAGKTTLVDLILGLLSPAAGSIAIDGRPLDAGALPAWQNSIGYVPQQIFLADASVLRNIAFGLPEKEIDRDAAIRAARIAQIDAFIVNELPQGYDTPVGERGIRLSGGQRQRIGIARALYHDPEVLLLDEATSALDSETEDALMRAVESLAGSKTIIMIAHRRNTLRACDCIVTVANGGATIQPANEVLAEATA